MPTQTAQSKAWPWPAICTIVALAAVYAFLQDIIAPDWPAWVLSPAIVVGFRIAVRSIPDDSLVRAALYQLALLLVPFMAVYGLVDAFTRTNWPEWVIAPALVSLFWAAVATIADAEAD